MAGSDLHTAMDILSSAALEEQGRLLRVEPLLSELHTAVMTVSAMAETPAGMIKLKRDERAGSASARLRDVLEEVLARQLRVELWHQVSVTFSSKHPHFRHTIARKLRSSLSEFTEIASSAATRDCAAGSSRPVDERKNFTQINSQSQQHVDKNLPPMQKMFTKKMVEKMVRILLVNRVGYGGPLFLPLTGGPGSGKTHLAQTLFNDARVMTKFPVRTWVHVSQRFDLSKILWSILNACHASVYIEDNQEVLKSLVQETLSDGRYLVVLDDVWSENAQEWRPLMQALPSNGTLILTSRIPAVVSCVATIIPHPLNTLEKKLQSIFSHLWAANSNEFRYVAENRQLVELYMQSAHASYLHLPLDLRNCLLYCSMFPPEYNYDPEELADLLAAEGRISPRMTQARRTNYLQKLFDECFHPVEESENATSKRTYKMHSMLHKFARFVDGKVSCHLHSKEVSDSGPHIKLNDIPTSVLLENKEAYALVRHLSIEYISLEYLLKFRNLRTLILLRERWSRNHQDGITKLPPLFCRIFRHLTVLDLQDSNISTLPRNFLMMSNLRYLNLSRTDIENIPGLQKLQFLETLILSHCEKLEKLHGNISRLVQLQKLDLEGCYYFAELPPNMSKMKSLQYLNVHECSSLTRMPCNMRELTNLQTMLGYVVPNNDGRAVSELQSLANLKKLSLEGLENISDAANARDVKLQDKQELESLTFRWNKSDDDSISRVSEVLEWLRPNQHLKTLDIVTYEGNELPSWMTSRDTYLISLVEIRLVNLRVCETLPPLGLLPLLKIVEISGAEAITSISDSFYGGSGTFPSLEKLCFSYMSNLGLWEQPHREHAFPCLAEVTIIQCPKLALHVELPSVRKLMLCMNNKMLYTSNGALGNMSHSLKHVSISFCQELRASSFCEGLQDLRRLKGMELCGCDEMTCLPQGLQHLSSLRSLTIVRCNKLETLPDWLQNLPSLHLVCLSTCPMLHSIPKGLSAQISVEDCPKLSPLPSETAWRRCDDHDHDEEEELLFADDTSVDFGDEKSIVPQIISENFHRSNSVVRDTICKDFGDIEPATGIASDLVQPDLYNVLMNIPGFSEEQLFCALSHLLDNEGQRKAFVDMPQLRQMWWIGNFLARHFQP